MHVGKQTLKWIPAFAGMTLFVSLFFCLPAHAEIATTADKLPLTTIPHYRPLVSAPQPKVEPGGSCAVRQDEVPPEFMKLLSKLDVPTPAAEIGEIPSLDDAPPSTLPQSRPSSPSSPAMNGGRVVHGVTVFQGGGRRTPSQNTTTHENGVTVYRGGSR